MLIKNLKVWTIKIFLGILLISGLTHFSLAQEEPPRGRGRRPAAVNENGAAPETPEPTTAREDTDRRRRPATANGNGAAPATRTTRQASTPDGQRRDRLAALRGTRKETEQERVFNLQNRVVTMKLNNSRRISGYLIFDNTLSLPKEKYVGIRIPSFGQTGVFAGIFVYPKAEISVIEYYDRENLKMVQYTIEEYFKLGREEPPHISEDE